MTKRLIIIQFIINRIKITGSSKSLNLSLRPKIDMITIIPIEPILRFIPKDQKFKMLPMISPKMDRIITLVIKLKFIATTTVVNNQEINNDKKGFFGRADFSMESSLIEID